jgi:uncharacterized phage protein (TIGR01671 family)
MEKIPKKFRIWLTDTKTGENGMFYQEDQYLSSFLRRIYDKYFTTHPSYLKFEIEDNLEQYIGLKDKNDKEIYEGDIISGNGKDPLEVVDYETIKARYFIGQFNIKNFVVIGNIHENPELIVN